MQQTIYNTSAKQTRYSPAKDHFIEGQLRTTSPKIAKNLQMLKNYQSMQASRLARPKERFNEDGSPAQLGANPNRSFMR